ncbi:MAG: tetratricopeptide repeat protein [Candidatus Portnoybacteria bacterium]|nr:tetratricopeptide repeat protein [Candidatus Portnoybacteria bacterium]MDD4982930.1 tetratricopeptide repeat protein [Candidatus Portnoybacteria bacterium]
MFQLIPDDQRFSQPVEAPKNKKSVDRRQFDLGWPVVSKWILVELVLMTLAVFLIHSASAVNQDLGRHLKLGELIWHTKQIPDTNFFSYTNPNFPFVNHHWLSEVIYYLLSLAIGIKGLIIFNALIILAAFALVWKLAWRKKYLIFSILAAILGAGLILERTDIRPETFGFLLFALFLFILDKNKEKISRSFWLLIPLELLWVNLHISFIYGLALIFFFFLDRLWMRRRAVYLLARQKKLDRYMAQVILLGLLAGAAALANPNVWRGALYPFYIFNNYGYSIAENQSPFFLEKLMFNPAIIFFKITLAALAVSFLFNWRKMRPFYLFLSVFFVITSWSAIRNFPLLGLAAIPVLSANFACAREQYARYFARWEKIRLRGVAHLLTIALIFVILIGSIYSVVSNRFYLKSMESERFGLGIPAGADAAIDFLKQNRVSGPMFNNFDIGGFLIWKAWPDYKVFIDGRPEAYPADFFQSVYIPMQTGDAAWQKYADDTYGINFVFFAHTDATPWGQSFIRRMVQRSGWKMVYLDSAIVIWARDNQANKPLILKYALNQENLGRYIYKYLVDNDFFDSVRLGSFFQTAGLNDLAIQAFDRALEQNPGAKQVWLANGMLCEAKNDTERSKAYFKKAIELDDGYIDAYLPLGRIYYQEGDFSGARRAWQKVLEIEPNNKSARSYLDNMGLIPFTK